MNAAVNFNNQFLLSTIKVSYKELWPVFCAAKDNGMLPEKLEARELSISQPFPKYLFLRGLVPPQLTTEINDEFFQGQSRTVIANGM